MPHQGVREFPGAVRASPSPGYLFSVVELVALRRVAPRPAAQRLPANRAVGASRSAAARGGVVAARQPLALNRYPNRDATRKRRKRRAPSARVATTLNKYSRIALLSE